MQSISPNEMQHYISVHINGLIIRNEYFYFL